MEAKREQPRQEAPVGHVAFQAPQRRRNEDRVDQGGRGNVIPGPGGGHVRVINGGVGLRASRKGEKIEVEGGVELLVTLGGTSIRCRFVIVDTPSGYNAIFGRPLINYFKAVPSSVSSGDHLLLRLTVIRRGLNEGGDAPYVGEAP
ncbi:hypothetical protein KSP39_PZI008162 [Platanthera zijinensis]|uniref:Uncharacterized protein n=1 Tax=Platanthera zijinensis TaxID=2320716 RepID=A0AAP0G8B6_9ASPA